MEKFTLTAEVVYTLKSKHGSQEFKGHAKLKEHGDNLLGAFIDLMHGNHDGNAIRNKMADHKYIMEHRQELETIFALQDAIFNIGPKPTTDHCDGHCNCQDCYADERR